MGDEVQPNSEEPSGGTANLCRREKVDLGQKLTGERWSSKAPSDIDKHARWRSRSPPGGGGVVVVRRCGDRAGESKFIMVVVLPATLLDTHFPQW